MCCFSERVEDVSSTKIFARLEQGRQVLVYQMIFSSDEDLAMILPIPVSSGTQEGAVEFISLEHFPGFFTMLDLMFPSREDSDLDGTASFEESGPTLEVHQVGCFDASFVPRIKDFSRLDERFRLPDNTFEQIGEYRDYGFVIFKLAHGDNQKVHPMAFSFPTRRPKDLFFPTIHIHNGQYHDKAEFDHSLYCQGSCDVEGWEESYDILGKRWDASFSVEGEGPVPIAMLDASADAAASEIVDRDSKCFRKTIRGEHKNEDQWILSKGGSFL